MVVVGLLNISVLISHLEHLIDHHRWLPVEFPKELIMVIEPADERRDNLVFEDVRDVVPDF
jgi:hypothetical protein